MANPRTFATVNHIRAELGIPYVSRLQRDLVLHYFGMEQADLDQIKGIIDASLETHLASVHEEISDFRADTDRRFAGVDENLDNLKDGVTALEGKFGGLDRRLDSELLDRNNLEDRVRSVIPNLPPRPQRI